MTVVGRKKMTCTYVLEWRDISFLYYVPKYSETETDSDPY